MKRLILFAMTLATTAATAQRLSYPKAEKGPTVDNYFGTEVTDPYRWLENDTSRQTAAWVEAENRITSDFLKKIPFRDKLLKRLTELSNYEKLSAPRKRHGKWYFFKNNGLQNQSVLYVMDQLGGEPRIFLDPNKLSTDGTVALKGVYFSNNGRWAAYSISRSGSDWQEFYVIDLKTGQLTQDHIEWAKFSGAAWQGDGFYYSAYETPSKGKEFSNINEGHKIYYHKIGTPQSEDRLFYQNPAYPKRFYTCTVNEEETMMFLYESGAGAGNNLYVRDLRTPDAQFFQMTDNMDYDYSPLHTEGDKIYLITNYNAPKSRIMTADIRRPGISDWQELIAEQNDVLSGADGHQPPVHPHLQSGCLRPCLPLRHRRTAGARNPAPLRGQRRLHGRREGAGVLLHLYLVHHTRHHLPLRYADRPKHALCPAEGSIQSAGLHHRAGVLPEQGRHPHPHVPDV